MALCANCGAKVPDDAAHCVQCGHSMLEVPEPAAPPKRTMMGIAGVDQKELQRAIEAARAATASGETPKKSARRTMMGVVAVTVPQIQKAAAERAADRVDDGWGAEGGAPAAPVSAKAEADPLDEGWGIDEPVAAPAPAPAASPAAPPTRPATPAAKATVMLSSMPAPAATPAPPPAPWPATAPLVAPRATVSFGSSASPTGPAASPRITASFEVAPVPQSMGPATRAPAEDAPRPESPRTTVAFSAMAPPPTTPATQATPVAPPRPTTGSRGLGGAPPPPRPTTGSRAAFGDVPPPRPTTGSRGAPGEALTPRPATGSRGVVEPPAASTGGPRTMALGAMAAPPTAPATRAAPPAAVDFAEAPTPLPPSRDLELADTQAGGPELSAKLAALAEAPQEDDDRTPPRAIGPSSPDPLADTISPGSMRLQDILREAEQSVAAAAPAPAPARPAATAPAPTAAPAPVTAKAPAASAATTTSPGTQPAVPSMPAAAVTSSASLKKSGTTTRPPFLASKALAEDMHPTEPGRAEMRWYAIVGGALLAALWAVPVSFSPLVFSWSAAGTLGGAAKVLAFYAPAAGALLLLLGLLPVPYRVRALGALVLGAIPIITAVGGLGPLEPTRGWPGALLAIGTIVLPGALVHRANYRASVLARVLVALGLLLLLAWMFIPGGSGFLPSLLAGFSSTAGMVQSVVMIAVMLAVATSLLAFMPSATTGGTGRTGRLMFLLRPALAGAAAVAAGTVRDAPVALAVSLLMLLVVAALAGLGMAQTLASIERPPSR